jgi:hypothetical protein
MKFTPSAGVAVINKIIYLHVNMLNFEIDFAVLSMKIEILYGSTLKDITLLIFLLSTPSKQPIISIYMTLIGDVEHILLLVRSYFT